MLCPKCNGESFRVVQTRKQATTIVRSRVCLSCDYEFKTQEVPTQGGYLVSGNLGVVDFDPARISRTAKRVGYSRNMKALIDFVLADCFVETNLVADMDVVMSMVKFLLDHDYTAGLQLLIIKGRPEIVDVLRQTAVNIIGTSHVK